MEASFRIVKKTSTEMCNSQFVRYPFIAKSRAATLHSNWFRKAPNELQVNQIGSIAEDGRWGTLMVIEHLYF